MAALPNREWPARASEALVDALREAQELARAGEDGKPLADALHFADDLLDIMTARNCHQWTLAGADWASASDCLPPVTFAR